MLSREITFDRKETLVCVCLFLAVVAIFGQTIRHEFINFDDPAYIYENPHVPDGLTASSVEWAFTRGYHSVWIPLTWLSLMLDWEFYDVHAGGYHLTNLLFARGDGNTAVSRAVANDESILAKRVRRSVVRRASVAC